MATSIVAGIVGYIPGLGVPSTIAGSVLSVISWADSHTWSTVSSLMTDKIDAYKYRLTVDINK